MTIEKKFEQNFLKEENQETPEQRLGETFKRITVLGTFSEPTEELKGGAKTLGEVLGKEDVTVLIGGQKGYPGAVKEGIVEGGGKALVAQPIEREKQGWIVENVPGRVRRVKVQDWEHIKDFLFHESTDAIIFMPPSETLGTITEALESIDRMTYWGTIEEPKMVPITFIGREWTDPKLAIPGTEIKISWQQLLKSLIQQEQEALKKRGIELNKKDYIRFVNNPQEAIDNLREWQIKIQEKKK